MIADRALGKASLVTEGYVETDGEQNGEKQIAAEEATEEKKYKSGERGGGDG